MDKEMMAKVNEILKKDGRRELSLDEADKVVGGGVGMFSFCGFEIHTEDDAYYLCYTLIPTMREAGFSEDIICDILTTSSQSRDFAEYYHAAGSDGLFNFMGLLFDDKDGHRY